MAIFRLAEALNRTQTGVQDGLTCDEERIRRWERGEVLWPHSPYRKALRELTGRTAEQLGFIPPSKQRERRLITARALPRDALRAEAELFDTMELARMADVSDIGPGTVEAVQEAVDLLCRAYPNTSALILRDRTKQRLKYVLNLLGGRLTLSQHRDILIQAGWLAALLGCLHFDLGEREHAEAARIGPTACARISVTWFGASGGGLWRGPVTVMVGVWWERNAFVSGEVDRSGRRPLRMIPWWAMVLGAMAVVASTVGTTLWLLSIAGHTPQLRIEAIKVGLSVGAGTGGAVALVLATRRQWLSERTQGHIEDVARENAYDATQRRVTELYGNAVEQLGHANAPVRLGGLYSLERLAQDQPEHRQTVVDVICAYLRMPFAPPPSTSTNDQQPSTDEVPGDTSGDTSGHGSDIREELQVRLTAQRLLARHLTSPADHGTADQRTIADPYWAGMRIDLNGAHLIDLDFSSCRVENADFRKTHFSGYARFREAQFNGEAEFGEAQFSGEAEFDRAQFSGNAGFREAQFSGKAEFDRAQFSRYAGFRGAQFSGAARFGRARFGGNAGFGGAQFSWYAGFGGARFSGAARFGGARFSGAARFGGARFSGAARFSEAQFSGAARFGGAQFSGAARFDRAEFKAQLYFMEAEAHHPNDQHIWPDGWQTEPSSPPGLAPLVRRSETDR